MCDSIALCQVSAPEYVLAALYDLCKKIFYVYPDTRLSAPVAAHPDLSVAFIGNTAVISRGLPADCRGQIEEYCRLCGYEILQSDSTSSDLYPADTGLCAAVGPDYIICRKASCDKAVLSAAEKYGKRVINVKQGYSKCSCALLADGAVITEDAGIAHALSKENIPCLLLDKKEALLPGYGTVQNPGGFIGGASGLCGNTLYFAGDISRHSQYDIISGFASQHATEIRSLGSGPLTDVGTIFLNR